VAKKEKQNWTFDAAGWPFWFVLFFIFAIVFIYIGIKFRDKDTALYSVLGLAAVLGATSAAIVSWAVNSVLQYIAKRRRIAEKKTSKRKKQ